ncbi:hypothetical protein AAVH_29260 [Aphelenchoides avenae]|nr:hypothetical protein AAVH_29260 [Aphelenchus avenae]
MDSVVIVRRKGTEPLKSGEFLGEMKDEHPKEEILEFVCGGNKQRFVASLDSANGASLSYDVMRDMVLRQREGPEITLKYERIHCDGAFQVSTVDLDKITDPSSGKDGSTRALASFRTATSVPRRLSLVL